MFHDRYELMGIIGQGGFAEVWRARDTDTEIEIALKIFGKTDMSTVRGLADEYAMVAGLNHTNLLHAEHFACVNNIPYLKMQYISGGALTGQIGRMTPREVDRMICDIAGALAYLHDNGIIHQDIKPGNILVNTRKNRNVYMLCDFGISAMSRVRMSTTMENTGTSMTEAYAPPEKFSSLHAESRPSAKGDVFSLGITLYEIISGDLPLDSSLSTGRELRYNKQLAGRLDFDCIADQAHRELVKACMAADPAERPDAEGVLDLLRRLRNRYPYLPVVKPKEDKREEPTVIVEEVAAEPAADYVPAADGMDVIVPIKPTVITPVRTYVLIALLSFALCSIVTLFAIHPQWLSRVGDSRTSDTTALSASQAITPQQFASMTEELDKQSNVVSQYFAKRPKKKLQVAAVIDFVNSFKSLSAQYNNVSDELDGDTRSAYGHILSVYNKACATPWVKKELSAKSPAVQPAARRKPDKPAKAVDADSTVSI